MSTRPNNYRFLTLLVSFALSTAGWAAPDPTVKVSLDPSFGPRTLEDRTQTAVVRDYIAAWKTMNTALSANDPGPLPGSFTGIAQEKLAGTIEQQKKLGLSSSYRDASHNIKLIFYSPEGLSIELVDEVEYDVQLQDHGKDGGTQHVHTHYVAVLTPTEVSWKVRIFQSSPE